MSRLPPPLPVVLDLAPLPRAQVGPFLILGVDKNADREALEANWAQRLIWARKNLINVPLEDINWAREILKDPDARARADATSLNIDTDGVLQRLRRRFQNDGQLSAGCRPIDIEKDLADYEPSVAMPDLEEVRRQILPPQIPRELPAVGVILEDLLKEPIDAWDVKLIDWQ